MQKKIILKKKKDVWVMFSMQRKSRLWLSPHREEMLADCTQSRMSEQDCPLHHESDTDSSGSKQSLSTTGSTSDRSGGPARMAVLGRRLPW